MSLWDLFFHVVLICCFLKAQCHRAAQMLNVQVDSVYDVLRAVKHKRPYKNVRSDRKPGIDTSNTLQNLYLNKFTIWDTDSFDNRMGQYEKLKSNFFRIVLVQNPKLNVS